MVLPSAGQEVKVKQTVDKNQIQYTQDRSNIQLGPLILDILKIGDNLGSISQPGISFPHFSTKSLKDTYIWHFLAILLCFPDPLKHFKPSMGCMYQLFMELRSCESSPKSPHACSWLVAIFKITTRGLMDRISYGTIAKMTY